ncbi:MAG: hypothetical protein ACO3K7_00615 [Candidatus Marinamargulisbacteria bacterium]
MTTSFIRPVSSSQQYSRDIFGTAFESTDEIYDTLLTFASSEEDGIVTLPSGKEIDVNTISGMTTFSTHLQFLQAHKELIDNIFVFVKNLENKLDNLLSS